MGWDGEKERAERWWARMPLGLDRSCGPRRRNRTYQPYRLGRLPTTVPKHGRVGTTTLGIEEAEVGRFGSYGYVIYGAKQQQ
nr:hypothetical protein Iba_chr04cCG2280 [Ipomoea batatas]